MRVFVFLLIALFGLGACSKTDSKQTYVINLAVQAQMHLIASISSHNDTIWVWENIAPFVYELESSDNQTIDIPEYPASLKVERVNDQSFNFTFSDKRDSCSIQNLKVSNSLGKNVAWSVFQENTCDRVRIGVAIRVLD